MMHRVMKQIVPALAAALATAALTAPLSAQEVAGDWVGPLDVAPGTRLALLVHIKRDDAGALNGTLDSPLQGAFGMPLADIKTEAGKLSFTVPSIGGSYQGQWNDAIKRWNGEWSQGGQRWPLQLRVPPPPTPLDANWQLPPDQAIAKLIADRNAPRPGQGIAIGVLGPEGQRIVAGGTGVAAKVDRNTLFEIGSISKVFTALILADMVNKSEVSLDDPAAKFLPAGHKMPERGGRQITLRDLSTHRSGLPRMPDDMGPVDSLDGPFVDYGEDKVLAFLDRHQLVREPGEKWEYSNLGVGLLGYLLGRAAHSDYETLVRKRITGPLGMKGTVITLLPRDAAKLVAPFDAYMRPAKPWTLGVFASAGGIRSSADDMLIFARAAMDPKSKIAAAMKTALAARGPGQTPETEQALGWIIAHPGPGRELLLHDGQTGGYRAILVLEPTKSRAVVALVNTAAEPSTTDLALHIMLGRPVQPTPAVAAAPPPPSKHTEITLPAAELDKFAGRYDFGSGIVVIITSEGGNLRAQRDGIPGAPKLPIFPEAPLAFFWKAVDAQIRFTADASGAITGAELAQGGGVLKGKRL